MIRSIIIKHFIKITRHKLQEANFCLKCSVHAYILHRNAAHPMYIRLRLFISVASWGRNGGRYWYLVHLQKVYVYGIFSCMKVCMPIQCWTLLAEYWKRVINETVHNSIMLTTGITNKVPLVTLQIWQNEAWLSLLVLYTQGSV